jgi:hypothetical protein
LLGRCSATWTMPHPILLFLRSSCFVPVVLQFDCGQSRYGFLLVYLARDILDFLSVRSGVFTHVWKTLSHCVFRYCCFFIACVLLIFRYVRPHMHPKVFLSLCFPLFHSLKLLLDLSSNALLCLFNV